MSDDRLEELIESFESSIPSNYKWNCFEKFKTFLYSSPNSIRIYGNVTNFVSALNYLTDCGKFEEKLYSIILGGELYQKIEPLSFNQYETEFGRKLDSDYELSGDIVFLGDCESEMSEEEFERQFNMINIDYLSENYGPLDFNDSVDNRKF
jgi:hypothetical protein